MGTDLGGSFQPCCAAREAKITPVCVCAAVRRDVITCQRLGRGGKIKHLKPQHSSV